MKISSSAQDYKDSGFGIQHNAFNSLLDVKVWTNTQMPMDNLILRLHWRCGSWVHAVCYVLAVIVSKILFLAHERITILNDGRDAFCWRVFFVLALLRTFFIRECDLSCSYLDSCKNDGWTLIWQHIKDQTVEYVIKKQLGKYIKVKQNALLLCN